MSEHDGEDRPRPRWAHRSPRRASEEQDLAYTPPEPVGAALERLVRHLGWGPRTATVGVIADWERVVGPDIAAHARAVSSDGTTLVVAVDDPAWATQLRWLEADLLARLAAETGVRFERLTVRVRPR
ncbi:MAG: DciA family protein [Acidimicrobiia bacterium]